MNFYKKFKDHCTNVPPAILLDYEADDSSHVRSSSLRPCCVVFRQQTCPAAADQLITADRSTVEDGDGVSNIHRFAVGAKFCLFGTVPPPVSCKTTLSRKK